MHRLLELARYGLSLAAVLLIPSWVGAQPRHSFMLGDTPNAVNPELSVPGHDRNDIFSTDLATLLAEKVSDRLTVALAALDPAAQVDAFSYGMDIGGLNDHSYFLFGIERTARGATKALPKSAMYCEPPDDAESDIVWVKDVRAVTRSPGTHLKAIEENKGSPVPGYFVGASKLLGLTGIVGFPNGTPPDVSNVEGFDFNPPSFATKSIYFSIDRVISMPGGDLRPADILLLGSSGTISVFRTLESMSLDVDDDIDALSLNTTGEGCPAGPIGWYSLTRTSPSVALGGEFSAADIFQFLLTVPQAPALGTQLHMTAESVGYGSFLTTSDADADIDSIAHIDPTSAYLINVFLAGDVFVESPATVSHGYVTATADGSGGAYQGTATTFSEIILEAGDYTGLSIRAEGVYGESLGLSLLRAPSPVPGVEDLVVTVAGGTASLSWTLPATPDYDLIEVSVDETVSTTLAGGATSANVQVRPGVSTIRVNGRLAGVQSEPAFVAADATPDPSLIGSLLPPESLASVLVGPDLELSWDNPISYESVEVTVDGATFATLTPPDPLDSVSLVGIPPGLYRVAVRGTVSLLGQPVETMATALEVAVMGPRAGDVLAMAPFPGTDPTAVAVDADHVYVVDASGNAVRYLKTDLAAPPTPVATPPVGFGFTGLATFGTDLLWVIQDQLWRTDLNGDHFLLGPLTFPGGTGAAGDATVDALGVLWVADGLNGRFTAHDIVSGLATGDLIEHPQGGGSVLGISFRADSNLFEVTHGDFNAGLTTHVSVVGDAALPAISLPLDPFGPDIRGVAWSESGSTEAKALYLVSGNGQLIEVAAVDPVPDFSLRDCHAASFGVFEQPAPAATPIPDNDVVQLQALFQGTGEQVGDLDVTLELTHESPADLQIDLLSPAGTTITLAFQPGGDYDSQQMTYRLDRRVDDPAGSGFNDGFGTREPAGPGLLADFDGEPVDGDWFLNVADGQPLGVGTLERWQISVCGQGLLPEPRFLRGDCSSDGALDVSDPIALIGFLFSGAPGPACGDSCDGNDDGQLNIGDVVFLLSHLFNGGPAPGAPGLLCGEDPTPDGLSCPVIEACP